jgi:hypothetical protein
MRKPGSLIIKDPGSDEPQGFDWTTWLAELGAGVAIGTSIWTITGPDVLLTKHDETIVTGAKKTQAYFAAGTLGKKYTIVNRVITNSSPPVTDERSFQYLIQNR